MPMLQKVFMETRVNFWSGGGKEAEILGVTR